MAAALAAAVPASAGLITQQHTQPVTALDFETAIAFDKFDTNLGALVGITVEIDAQITGTVSYQNNGSVTRNVALNFDGPLAVYLGSQELAAASVSWSESATAAPGASGTYTISETAVVSVPLNPSLWAAFTADGPETITLDFITMVDTWYVGSGSFAVSFDLYGAGTVRLIYDDPPFAAPEPGSLALIGLGLLALGAARRRSRA